MVFGCIMRNVLGNNPTMEKKNWNLFVGDNTYKSNQVLEFVSPYTFDKFKHDKFQRYKFLIRGFACVTALGWMVVYMMTRFTNFITFLLGICSMVAAFYMTRTKYTSLHVRVCFLLVEYCFQASLFLYVRPFSLLLYLSLFNGVTFISSNLQCYDLL